MSYVLYYSHKESKQNKPGNIVLVVLMSWLLSDELEQIHCIATEFYFMRTE